MKPLVADQNPLPIVVSLAAQERADRLREAAVCGEQAREAARIKRWHAASGLFSTAIALCRQAEQVSADEQERAETLLLLHQLTQELSVYAELTRSLNRPLRRS